MPKLDGFRARRLNRFGLSLKLQTAQFGGSSQNLGFKGLGIIGIILGLYRDNGKEIGNYYLGFRVSQNWRYLFRGPFNKDSSILGFILGSAYLAGNYHIAIIYRFQT